MKDVRAEAAGPMMSAEVLARRRAWEASKREAFDAFVRETDQGVRPWKPTSTALELGKAAAESQPWALALLVGGARSDEGRRWLIERMFGHFTIGDELRKECSEAPTTLRETIEGIISPEEFARRAVLLRGKFGFLRWALCSPRLEEYVAALEGEGYREPSFGHGAASLLTLLSEPSKDRPQKTGLMEKPKAMALLSFAGKVSEAGAFCDGTFDGASSRVSSGSACVVGLSNCFHLPSWSPAQILWMTENDFRRHPFAKAFLSAKYAGLAENARGDWPIHGAATAVGYQATNDMADDILTQGGDPNALDDFGRTPWMCAADPFSETGTEGPVSLMSEDAAKWWEARGADFSMEAPSVITGLGRPVKMSEWMRKATRKGDAERMGVFFENMEALALAKKEREALLTATASGKEKTRKKV